MIAVPRCRRERINLSIRRYGSTDRGAAKSQLGDWSKRPRVQKKKEA